MRLSVLIFLVSLWSQPPLMAVESSSGVNLARALELLQKNEKSKALKLLEKAFESTTDSEELKQISILILEASPSNYPKREGYLQYLIKFNADHADAWRWYKEMGDRAFEHAKMDEAEDWYLRAKPLTTDPSVIQYKLAWVYWNLNRKVEAFQDFLEVHSSAESTLRLQILKDLSKLWWEIGVLPPAVFDQAMSLAEDQRTELLEKFIHATPTHLEAGPSVEALLVQLKSDDRSREYFYKGLKSGFQFKASPCFLFNSVLTPDDEFSKDNFLACLKSKDRPSAEKLAPYFVKLEGDNDERIVWAAADLDVESEKISDAALRLLKYPLLTTASKDFLKYAESILLKLDEEGFRKLYEFVGAEAFETLVEKSTSDYLLDRLEAIDADRWLPVEEKKYKGRALPRSFLLKKGISIAQKNSSDLSELEKLFNALTKVSTKADEKKMADDYSRLSKLANSKLPAEFSPLFKKKYDDWISNLDKSLNRLKSAPADWQIIARPIFQRQVDKNIEQLIAQIDAAKIDSKIDDIVLSFEQKKEELKADLRLKYSGVAHATGEVEP